MTVRKAEAKDLPILGELACGLWPHHTPDAMRAEMAETLEMPDAAFFLAFAEKTSVGFAQCQLRHDYVEGTTTSPVGYMEGIYVMPEYQNHGLAKQLLGACESWAREKGCTEFASDCELSNDAGFSFHLSMGFTEVNRIICFRKTLYDRSME